MKTNEVKELPKLFEGRGEVKGFTFSQLRTSEKAIIYEVRDNETGNLHFEVFLKVFRPECHIWKDETGKMCSSKNPNNLEVVYPHSGAFGAWAWTYRHMEKALNKFQELNPAAETNLLKNTDSIKQLNTSLVKEVFVPCQLCIWT